MIKLTVWMPLLILFITKLSTTTVTDNENKSSHSNSTISTDNAFKTMIKRVYHELLDVKEKVQQSNLAVINALSQIQNLSVAVIQLKAAQQKQGEDILIAIQEIQTATSNSASRSQLVNLANKVTFDDTPVQPCNNHCPDNSYYCLTCCKAHGFTGGKGNCRGPTCYCAV